MPDTPAPGPLAWWKHLDPRTGPRQPRPPTARDTPVFAVGATVRLVARPERARRVLAVTWHAWRHVHVYTVETSTPSEAFAPYWFGEQLAPVAPGAG